MAEVGPNPKVQEFCKFVQYPVNQRWTNSQFSEHDHPNQTWYNFTNRTEHYLADIALVMVEQQGGYWPLYYISFTDKYNSIEGNRLIITLWPWIFLAIYTACKSLARQPFSFFTITFSHGNKSSHKLWF